MNAQQEAPDRPPRARDAKDGYGYGVIGVGHHLPDRIVANAEIAAACGATEQWIDQKTGVVERRRMAPVETIAGMGAVAARRAIADAADSAPQGWDGPDMLVVATTGTDRVIPAPAFDVHALLELGHKPAFSLDGACAGVAQGMVLALSHFLAGFADTTVVVGSSQGTFFADQHDKRIAPLFGDGAGAFVMGPVPADYGILAWRMFTDSSLNGSLFTDRGCRNSTAVEPLQMRGHEVADLFATKLPELIVATLDDANLRLADISRLFVHQGNVRMVEGLGAILGLSPEQVPTSGRWVGNTASASLPIAVSMAADELVRGDIVVFVTAGAGVNGAVLVMKWF